MNWLITWSLHLLTGAGVLLGFGILVFVHELGHFLAARYFKFQIDVFSIGFGPAIWRKKINGIEYKIGWIPFGGYVALPQLDPSGMEKVQGGEDSQTRALAAVAAWKRIVVAFAGPFGNIILAVILAYFIYWIPNSRIGIVETRIGSVLQTSAAWQAGLRTGDRITAVNGHKVDNWSDMTVENILVGDSHQAAFTVERKGETIKLVIPLTQNKELGIQMLDGVAPEMPCMIEQINPGSPAEKSGVTVGDQLKSVNGVPVFSVRHFISLIAANGTNTAEIAYQRRGVAHMTQLTPCFDETLQRAIIGVVISGGDSQGAAPWMMYRDPWDQLRWDSMSVVRLLKGLVAPKQKGERAAIASNIGGPPMILMSLFSVIQNSFMDTVGFLRMLCINLAILNLLPLPILDGGHIMFALFEIITRRKPHPKFIAFISNAFAILLIGLMLFLSFRDIAGRIKRERMIRAAASEETTDK